jgi:hypothetical protein
MIFKADKINLNSYSFLVILLCGLLFLKLLLKFLVPVILLNLLDFSSLSNSCRFSICRAALLSVLRNWDSFDLEMAKPTHSLEAIMLLCLHFFGPPGARSSARA